MIVTGAIIHEDPVVVLTGVNGAPPAPAGFLSCDALLDRPEPIYFFVNPMWSLTPPAYRATVMSGLRRAARDFPHHRYTFLVNDPNEYGLVEELPSIFESEICGEHACVDPDLFPFLGGAEPAYDAAYIARIEGGKRLYLAARVPRLCVISRDIDAPRYLTLRTEAPEAICANVTEDGFRQLSPDEVSAILAQSACGLILSEREGQNRATIEYLLSGLPVVSTPNIGGRDRFLHPGNSIYAAAMPDAVAAAVRFATVRPFDRRIIAGQARIAVERERDWLFHLIKRRLERDGFTFDRTRITLPHHAFSASGDSAVHLARLAAHPARAAQARRA